MEFAAVALSQVAAAITPAATATATAVGTFGGAAATTGGVAAAGGSSLVGSLLQGALSIGGALAAFRASEISAGADEQAGLLAGLNADLAAGDAETQIDVEGVRGLERRNSLRRALIQSLGEQDVATAASGVDLSFGSPATARREAVVDTERALGIDRATQDFRVTRLKERAKNFRLKASEVRRGGFAKAAGRRAAGAASAVGELGSTGLDLLRRG